MRTLLRLLLILVLPIIGAVVGFCLGLAELDGRFEPWHALGQPPEPAVSVVTRHNGVWITTASGAVYEANDPFGCTKACWAPVIPLTVSTEDAYLAPLEWCGPLPLVLNARQTGATCEYEGVGALLTVYTLRADGSVWVWRNLTGTEFGWIDLVIGTGLGFGIGCILMLILPFYLILGTGTWTFGRRRASQKSTPPLS